jgi:nitroimidazol reductase NimA-like FMN-containing flavoprotein (pyridoxamine 5'-phosphate oxidase superfamily)
MIIHELSPADCADVLSRTNLARLACCRMNQPYVVPVSFAYDPRQVCLLLFSAVGRKVEWMRENPNVCLEIEDLEDRFHWTTVVVFGRYDELGDGPGDSETRLRALHLFNDRSRWWLPGAAKPGGVDHQGVVIYRIHIDRMTGRRTARPEHSPSGTVDDSGPR